MRRYRFEIGGSWDDGALLPGERASIELVIGEAIEVRVEATDYGDPPPDAAPGALMGLWDFEVVELFLLGRDDRYLELELGPHGHHLALRLDGRRRIVERELPVDYEAARHGATWSGRARLALDLLPPDVRAANAYAIHGRGAARRYLAWRSVPGPAPDFHRLERFGPLELAALR